ncbi:Uncharacterised protein [Vibrio cholerae]|nr:Uncharacterised protein [Vibrio cholerae]
MHRTEVFSAWLSSLSWRLWRLLLLLDRLSVAQNHKAGLNA